MPGPGAKTLKKTPKGQNIRKPERCDLSGFPVMESLYPSGRMNAYFFLRMVFSMAILVTTLSTRVMTVVGTKTCQKE